MERWNVDFVNETSYKIEASSIVDAHRRAQDARVSSLLNELSRCRRESEIDQLFKVWKKIGRNLTDANLCAISLESTH